MYVSIHKTIVDLFTAKILPTYSRILLLIGNPLFILPQNETGFHN